MFSKEILPSLETGRSLIGAERGVFLEGLCIIGIMEDGAGIRKDALLSDNIIFIVLVCSTVGPGVIDLGNLSCQCRHVQSRIHRNRGGRKEIRSRYR